MAVPHEELHAFASDVLPVAVPNLPAPHDEPHAFASDVLPVAVPNLPAPHDEPHAFASDVLPVAVPNLPAPHDEPHAVASELLPAPEPYLPAEHAVQHPESVVPQVAQELQPALNRPDQQAAQAALDDERNWPATQSSAVAPRHITARRKKVVTVRPPNRMFILR